MPSLEELGSKIGSVFIRYICPFSPPIQDGRFVRPETFVVDWSWKQTFVTKKKEKEKEKTYLETKLLKPRHMFKAKILFHLRPPNSIPNWRFRTCLASPADINGILQHIHGAIHKWSTIISARSSAQAEVFLLSAYSVVCGHGYIGTYTTPNPQLSMSAYPVLQLKVWTDVPTGDRTRV